MTKALVLHSKKSENLDFLYYHTMNPGSRCLGSFWVHRVFVSICLGRGRFCLPSCPRWPGKNPAPALRTSPVVNGKHMADGKVTNPYKHLLRYGRGKSKDASPAVNPEQAETVKRIYRKFKRGNNDRSLSFSFTDLRKNPLPDLRIFPRSV